MLITLVAGARPNFMKIAPLIKAIEKYRLNGIGISYRLVHTGQHYDNKMSGNFFQQLGIPEPSINLEAGSGTQAEQTASIMVKFEKELISFRPTIVIVVGDVTSTMACTITAKKLGIDVAHVEAGIRSGDMTMPEEINRIVTDSLCDHFFTTSEVANRNLISIGADKKQIHFVGNTMIDTLFQNMGKLKKPDYWEKYGLTDKGYFLTTLHRPGNVDDPLKLKELLDAILAGTNNLKIIFPVHPRTQKTLMQLGYTSERLIQIEPQGYLEFIYLVKNSLAIITDSGGITEEATVLGVPCMTLRNSTERPETVDIGSNVLVGVNPDNLYPYLEKILQKKWKKGGIPALWDGQTSERIVSKLIELYISKTEKIAEKEYLFNA